MTEEKPNGASRLIRWMTKDPHGEPGKLPEMFRLSMIFIDRIGFPITAFLIMTALCAYLVYKVIPLGESINTSLKETVDILRSLKK